MRWVFIHDGMKATCQPHEVPPDCILESLYKKGIRESDQLKTVLALYDQDILQKVMPSSYQRLKTTVKKILDHNVRAVNFEARNERTMTKTPVKSRSTEKSVSVEKTQGRLLSVESKREVCKGRSLQFSPRSQ